MSSHKTDDKAAADIPEYLIDSKKGARYQRLRFFGKVIGISSTNNCRENSFSLWMIMTTT